MTLNPDAQPATFLAAYAKQHHAGAFATPTAKELAGRPGSVQDWRGPGDERTVAVVKTLTRDSARADFTGRTFHLPAGARVITHYARTPGAPVPDLDPYDYLHTYVEDASLTAALRDQGREPLAVRVTAAAELITCWGREGDAHRYPDYDVATVTPVHLPIPDDLRPRILAEVQGVDGWDDDFPYYSDGSWSAVSLRGFWPDDPSRGVKPSEMPKSWKAENPDALGLDCQWTVAAERCPSIAALVQGTPWMGRTERVRLLKMAGRDGKGGALGRHTDITDRDGGTRDGQITRFHIPLVTDPRIHLHTWDLDGIEARTHLEPWSCYYLDARKPHAVTNPTGVDRVHLVVDVVTDAAVRQVITEGHRAGVLV